MVGRFWLMRGDEMSWNDEQIETLKILWAQGKSASEIAEILGDTTRNAVIGKAHRIGLSGRPSPIKKKSSTARRTTMTAITERMCKWPFGDPKKSDFYFCGRAVDVATTYCAEHRALAYTPLKKVLIASK